MPRVELKINEDALRSELAKLLRRTDESHEDYVAVSDIELVLERTKPEVEK